LSSGIALAIPVSSEQCHLQFGLKNEKVYKAHYYEFSTYFDPYMNKSIDIQVKFKSADYEKGYYENLEIFSVDPGFGDFKLKFSDVKTLDNSSTLFLLMFPLYMFLNFNIMKAMFGYSHYSVSFNSKFCSLNILAALIVVCIYYGGSQYIILVLVSEIFLTLFSIFLSPVKSFCSKDFFKLVKKNILFVILNLGIVPLIMLIPEYLPIIMLGPVVFWIADKMTLTFRLII